MTMDLDVRFSEDVLERDPGAGGAHGAVDAAQSDRQEFSHSDSRTVESAMKFAAGVTAGLEVIAREGPVATAKVDAGFNFEQSFSSSYTSTFTRLE